MQAVDYRSNDKRFFLFVILNLGVLILVFLAFLFSALTYVGGRHLADEVHLNNSNLAPADQVANNYKVAVDFFVQEGTVASFCADSKTVETNTVCEGLGPAWLAPFQGVQSTTGAAFGVLTQLYPDVAIYSYVLDEDHTQMLITVIDTSKFTSTALQTTTFKLSDNSSFTSLRVDTTSEPHSAAIMFSSHNTTYLMVGSLNSDLNKVVLSTPVVVFTTDVQSAKPLRSYVAQVASWTLVVWGYDSGNSNYKGYMLDNTPSRLNQVYTSEGADTGLSLIMYETLAVKYVGGGRFLQANANSYGLGFIDFDAKTVTIRATADMKHHYDTVHITPIYDNWVVFSGVQYLYVDSPLTVAFVVAINNTMPWFYFLGDATPIFTTSNIVPMRSHISVTYVLPHTKEPYGGLFFTYVDARSRRAKIVRSRPAYVNGRIQLVSSPSFDISTYEYGRYALPLIAGPTANNLTLMVLQEQGAVYNSFFWSGGYQYAGIVQANATAGQTVSVVRRGISSNHNGLIAGRRYYATNNGALLPYTVVIEGFTQNSNRWYIGTAISDNQLLINEGAFEAYGYR